MSKPKNRIKLGRWELLMVDGSKTIIEIKNQTIAKFIYDNMSKLNIIGWEALDTE